MEQPQSQPPRRRSRRVKHCCPDNSTRPSPIWSPVQIISFLDDESRPEPLSQTWLRLIFKEESNIFYQGPAFSSRNFSTVHPSNFTAVNYRGNSDG